MSIAQRVPQSLLGTQQLLLVVCLSRCAVVERHLGLLNALCIVMLRCCHLVLCLLDGVRALGLSGVGWCDGFDFRSTLVAVCLVE